MPKSENQKLKILYILDYLKENTDSEHIASATVLVDMLQSHDIPCERKTIVADIEALNEYGYDIQSVRGRKGGFYLNDRDFDAAELKLLIDAVQSSRFLSENKSNTLIKKLCKLCNIYDAKLMNRDVYISERVRTMNGAVLYEVNTIQEAIAANRQITFRYFDWGLDGKKIFRDKTYIASPYGLCQDNGFYYLLAHSERHGVTVYRVDRMNNVNLLESKRVPCPELTGKALTEYANQHFQMYSAEPCDVKMRFDRSLANVVIDRFGTKTILIPDGDNHFVFTARVAVSDQFLSWIIGFGAQAKILYPQSAVDKCKELCRSVMAQYE